MRAGARAWQALREESGIALPIVLMVSMILFVLAIMIIGLATYRTTAVQKQIKRQEAMYLADKGINEYLVLLHQGGTPTSTITGADTNGSFTVTATALSGGLYMMRAVGTLPDGTARAIRAQVTFKKFSDFAAVTDSDYNIASGATAYGDVYSNGNVTNSGTVTGKIWAGGSISGSHGHSGSNNPPDQTNAPSVAFSAVTNTLAQMKTAALANTPDTYWGPSGTGNYGYQVTLNGYTATIATVTALNGTGVVKTTAANPVTVLLPPNGLIFCDDDVYVSGTFAAYVTVVAADPNNVRGNIWIAGNIVPQDTNGVYTNGLIAQDSIYDVMSTAPNDQTIYGALLAQNGDITTSGSTSKNSVTYYGTAGASGNIGRSGSFNTRNYYHWARLDTNPPPMEPPLGTGQFGLQTWVEGQ